MKSIIIAVIAAFLIVAPSSNGVAETVREFIIRTADARNFDPDFLHSEAKVIAIGMGMEMTMSHEQLIGALDQMAAMVQGFEISDFKMLHETTVGNFVSVGYSYTYEIVMSGSTFSGTVRNMEILEKQGSSFRFVFGVQNE